METENNGGNKLIVWIVVIVVVAIIAAVWLSMRGPAEETNTNQAAALGLLAAQEANQAATLEVGPQFPGLSVYIPSANFPAGGWIVVRQPAEAGEILGQTWFPAGTRIGNVELTQPTVDGQSYVAEVYTDDGDGVFDAAKDLLVTNPSGAALSVPFTATKDLPEIKG